MSKFLSAPTHKRPKNLIRNLEIENSKINGVVRQSPQCLSHTQRDPNFRPITDSRADQDKRTHMSPPLGSPHHKQALRHGHHASPMIACCESLRGVDCGFQFSQAELTASPSHPRAHHARYSQDHNCPRGRRTRTLAYLPVPSDIPRPMKHPIAQGPTPRTRSGCSLALSG